VDGVFFWRRRRKEKKHKKKKTIKKKKKCKERRELTFLVFFFRSKRKEKAPKKKIIEKKKNAKKGGSLPFFSRFYIWDEVLLLPSPLHVPSTLSSPPSSNLVSRVFSKICATQAWEPSQALEMEWAGNEVKEVGGEILGQRRGLKNPWAGKEDVFWFIPKTAWTASSWTGALVAAGWLQPPKRGWRQGDFLDNSNISFHFLSCANVLVLQFECSVNWYKVAISIKSIKMKEERISRFGYFKELKRIDGVVFMKELQVSRWFFP